MTGLIAIGYVIHDGEMALDRASAILVAVVALFHVGMRVGRRCWRQAHINSPELAYPPDR